MKETVHLNIGSNIGDSRSLLERAVAAVFLLHEGDAPPRRSSVVESEPWGFESANRFLNTGVEIETSLPPLRLLERLRELERSIAPAGNHHRCADGSYRDRYLDIDIIFYGTRVIA
ncbi:MAG: 2-amino-4-hydroxy-6-hydroxymethyldihydropteridine diphosphokinase, partial [Muribaculaceae bacterium]|nr:2-amino-4-hydroxy-6-hydroxymethyldihydropteridine diphosphokinase [Muribaculaceae bacterium]